MTRHYQIEPAKNFFARLPPRVMLPPVLFAAARACVGMICRSGCSCYVGVRAWRRHGHDLLGVLACLAQTACVALLTCCWLGCRRCAHFIGDLSDHSAAVAMTLAQWDGCYMLLARVVVQHQRKPLCFAVTQQPIEQSHTHTYCCTTACSWSRASSQNLQSALLPNFRHCKPGMGKVLNSVQHTGTGGTQPYTFACIWIHRNQSNFLIHAHASAVLLQSYTTLTPNDRVFDPTATSM